jgi:pyruvate dehydrogenase E2 component (dihydrolipoamide acetyltransferase)
MKIRHPKIIIRPDEFSVAVHSNKLLDMLGARRLAIFSMRVIGRGFSSLPPHVVVGLPSLSPTMTNGSVSKWEKKVGDKCGAGDSLALIETDKASMSFDAQDDFYVAKILVEEGQEIAVGAPIMITVEDQSAVAAFADYVLPLTASASVVVEKAPEPMKVSPPVVVKAPAPVARVEAPKPAPSIVDPPKPVQSVQPPAVKASPAIASAPWGSSIKSSPLVFKLAKLQNDYVAKYGFTGHVPLEIKSEKKEKAK